MLWIEDSDFTVKNVLMYLFLTNTQFLPHKTLIDELEWCGLLVMFSSAVRTLILTAPIHCRGSTGEQMM